MDYSEYTFENSSVNNDSQTISGNRIRLAFEEDDDEADLTQERIVRQQLDSFDDFIERGLYEVINETPMQAIRYSALKMGKEIMTQYSFEFDKPSFTKPQFSEYESIKKQLFPNEARLRGLTYYEIDYNENDLKGYVKTVVDEPISVMVLSKFLIADLTFEELKEHH
ncbi:13888_t:CDS:2 [Funneliformis mosseae]|uniref:DNA-directed RNA polymerase n=1 Tax=Funneliformis mosseae TaxID=27381 RepID=A0A9N9BKD7_FUNMO|nr:13888_t:CDS:2 [Funneliformis mosseae]